MDIDKEQILGESLLPPDYDNNDNNEEKNCCNNCCNNCCLPCLLPLSFLSCYLFIF